jgi:hypothetical protein
VPTHRIAEIWPVRNGRYFRILAIPGAITARPLGQLGPPDRFKRDFDDSFEFEREDALVGHDQPSCHPQHDGALG